MRRALLVGLVSLVANTAVVGQPLPNRPTGRPPSRPTVSPYLNLRRGDNSAAINYYGIVRPQFEAARQFRQIESDLSSQERSIRGLEEDASIPATGHAAGFGNYLHYYNFSNQRSSLGSSGTGRRSASRSTTISTAPIYLTRPVGSPAPSRPVP